VEDEAATETGCPVMTSVVTQSVITTGIGGKLTHKVMLVVVEVTLTV
jgi:hypothetical protein